MSVEEGRVNAQIDVTQQTVKSTIESQLTDLRQALHERGFDVQRIDVFASTQSSFVGDGGQSSRGNSTKQRRGRFGLDDTDDDPEQGPRTLGYNTLEITM